MHCKHMLGSAHSYIAPSTIYMMIRDFFIEIGYYSEKNKKKQKKHKRDKKAKRKEKQKTGTVSNV